MENFSTEKCFLESNNDAYFYLSPLKKEVVMTTPIEIYIYHDIATNKEMDSIRSIANSKVFIRIMNYFMINPYIVRFDYNFL